MKTVVTRIVVTVTQKLLVPHNNWPYKALQINHGAAALLLQPGPEGPVKRVFRMLSAPGDQFS